MTLIRHLAILIMETRRRKLTLGRKRAEGIMLKEEGGGGDGDGDGGSRVSVRKERDRKTNETGKTRSSFLFSDAALTSTYFSRIF